MMKIGDMRLNRSGTIGTEPIAKIKDGKLVTGTEVKFGRLGSAFLPGKTARAENQYQRGLNRVENKEDRVEKRYARNLKRSEKTVMSDDSTATLSSNMTKELATKRFARGMGKVAKKATNVADRYMRKLSNI